MAIPNVVYVVGAVFVMFCILSYNKLVAKFKKNSLEEARKRMDAGDEYIKQVDKLVEELSK
jgi:hypothetical protein